MMITVLLAMLNMNAPAHAIGDRPMYLPLTADELPAAHSMTFGNPGQSRHHRPDAGDRPEVFTASETAPALDGPRAPKPDAEMWADAVAHDLPSIKDSAPRTAESDDDCGTW